MDVPRLLGRSAFLLLTLLMLQAPCQAMDQPVVQLSDGMGSAVIGNDWYSLYEDTLGLLRIEDVSAPGFAGRFGHCPRNNFGYTRSALWLRLCILDSSTAPRRWILTIDNVQLDKVCWYLPRPDGTIEQRCDGRMSSVYDKPVHYRCPLTVLESPGPAPCTLYVRIATTDVMTFPLAVHDQERFWRHIGREQIAFGMYFGILGVMALLNLLIFLTLRDRAYIYYVVYVISYTFFHLCVVGISYAYLWPAALNWNYRALPFFCGLTIVTGTLFSVRFLDVRRFLPRLFPLAFFFVATGTVQMLMALSPLAHYAGELGNTLALLLVLTLAVLGVTTALKGYLPARYYLVALAFCFAGVSVNSLKDFGVLPTNFFTNYGTLFGTGLQVIFFSLALMARISAIQKEKEQAQAKALRHQAEAMENLRTTMEYKLQALQAKINPHFLFNTLNTISGLIYEAPAKAERVIEMLAKLFRYTLAASQEKSVPLVKELELVRMYLEIEKIRFDKRLEYEVSTAGPIEEVMIPGMIIQPLVENSIKHGIGPKVGGGRISVHVQAQQDTCRITVADSGVGLDKDKTPESGHGLVNIRERLHLAFSDRYQMDIADENGVRIDITFPTRGSL
jgi:signal transduction histidine kinase